MEFYFYVYLSRPSIRIHHAGCSFCRPLKGPQQPVLNQETNYWSGPYTNYTVLLSQARTRGEALGTSPVDCMRCQPAKFALSANQKEMEMANSTPNKSAVIPARQLKVLQQTHRQQDRELMFFYIGIRALLQARHQAQRLEGLAEGVSQDQLLFQQDNEKEELVADQLNSYRLLQEQQATERAALQAKTG